jgi:hypothetical protein
MAAMCCAMMQVQLQGECPQHADPADCPDSLVVRSPEGRFGLRIHDGGSGSIKIRHCPWCGAKLKKSLGAGR